MTKIETLRSQLEAAIRTRDKWKKKLEQINQASYDRVRKTDLRSEYLIKIQTAEAKVAQAERRLHNHLLMLEERKVPHGKTHSHKC